MLTLHGVSYIHPNGDRLFSDVDLTINKYEKSALIGNNGVGKSTLMKIMAGALQPTSGVVKSESKPYYLPQMIDDFNTLTVAGALGVHHKVNALKEILSGNANETHLDTLDNDWSIEDRCVENFSSWGLTGLSLDYPMKHLSGGEKTKIFLAGIRIHEAEVVLLDEPSNHLDSNSRKILYDYVSSTTHTLVIISHDRVLLNLLNLTYELGKHGMSRYGGNFDFYAEQKSIENQALADEIKSKEKELRKAREVERDALERKQKLDARGKRKQQDAGLPTIMMKTFRNNAEKSTARLKESHTGKINDITHQVQALRQESGNHEAMKMNFDSSLLHPGKVLIRVKAVNFGYHHRMLWRNPLTFQISSGERISISGANGSGKTTLVKLMLGLLQPDEGSIQRTNKNTVYVDQQYSLLDPALSLYEQVQAFNSNGLQEHEIKIRLNRFLFSKTEWDKRVRELSGGEKMKLILCSLSVQTVAPDSIILDEPTNNLDLESLGILTNALREYSGTLIVISHDSVFLKEIGVTRSIDLNYMTGE